MPPPDVTLREYIESRLHAMRDDVTEIRDDLAEIKADVKALRSTHDRAAGGLGTAKWLAGVGGLAGIGALLQQVFGTKP